MNRCGDCRWAKPVLVPGADLRQRLCWFGPPRSQLVPGGGGGMIPITYRISVNVTDEAPSCFEVRPLDIPAFDATFTTLPQATNEENNG